MRKIVNIALAGALILACCGTGYHCLSMNQSAAAAETQEVVDGEASRMAVEDAVKNGLAIDNAVVEVDSGYVSQDHLEDAAANSESNLYCGYTREELDEKYSGGWVICCDENGQMVPQAFQAYDDFKERVVQNVAVGGGVILVTVTVSVATGGTAPAVSAVLAVSAETAANSAALSAAVCGLTGGVTAALNGEDAEGVLRDVALEASEGFKWGALIGAVTGAAGEAAEIGAMTESGLTADEAVLLRNSGYSDDVISSIHSVEEAEVYETACLEEVEVNGEEALVREIDWESVGEDGLTNAQRAANGNAPLDANGNPYELHHIGQSENSPLAILTREEHRIENSSILHWKSGASEIDREVFDQTRKEFWQALEAIQAAA